MTENGRQEITEEQGVHKQWYVDARAQTPETLSGFLRHLSEDYGHDYGTICHAIAAGMIGTGHAINRGPQGGITGFQASAIMWEFISSWMHYEGEPLRLVRYRDMLYPQYEHNFQKVISAETWAWLQEEAQKLLDTGNPATEVKEHWQSIVGGIVPFGYTIKGEEDSE